MFKDYIFVIDLELRNKNSDLNLLSAQKVTSILYSKVLTKSNNIFKEQGTVSAIAKISARNSTGILNDSFKLLKKKRM